jgi:8-oxo-dGTP diphosphatase
LSAPEQSSSEPAAAVQVVAAVIHRPDGRFLLAQRPAGKVYAGYWEFPGGKIEPGESAPAALARELHEELGIEVRQAYPWITRHYVYEHATVDLHFYRVTRFDGTPQGRENQAFTWQHVEHIDVGPMLPANGPILAALALPHVYGITNAGETGAAAAIRQVERALERGMRLIQVREPGLTQDALRDFAAAVVLRAHGRRARVVINADVDLSRAVAADGVHLKASALRTLSERPACPLVGASCHDAEELALAVRLGADFAVLGPVAPTPSHPGAPSLGFDAFARIVRGCPIPVYALGGMRQADMTWAWACGAHGIAMQRGAWGG